MLTDTKDKKEYLHLGQPLRNYIRRYIDQEADVEDIFQATYLKMMEMSGLANIINKHGYACKVAKNLIIDRSRQPYINDEEITQEPGCEKGSLDKQLEYQQRIEIYQKIILNMPNVRQDVFIRYRIKGQAKEQICQEMDLSVEAVNKHITRALSCLKEQIQLILDEKI